MTNQDPLSVPQKSFAKQLTVFFIAIFLGYLAVQMFYYSIIIFWYTISDSVLSAGILNFFMRMPIVLLGFVWGALLDRHSRKKIVLISLLGILGVIALFIASLQSSFLSGAPIVLFVLAVLFGAAYSAIGPGAMALLGQIVPKDKIETGTNLILLFTMVDYALAPAFVGILKENFNWTIVFSSILVLTGVAWALLATIKPRPMEVKTEPSTSMVSEIRSGMAYVKNNPVLLQTFIFVGLLFLIGGDFIKILMPKFASENLSLKESLRGIYVGLFWVGMIAGNALSFGLLNMKARGKIIIGATVGVGTTIVLLPFIKGLVGLVWPITVGMVAGSAVCLLISTMQGSTSEEYRGRVTSFYNILANFMPSIGGLYVGFVSDKTTIPSTLIIIGCLTFGLSFLGLTALGALRRYQRQS